MRKHLNWLTGLLCLASLVFFGCSNALDGTVSGDDYIEAKTLDIVVENYSEVFATGANGARTIQAAQYDLSETLYFYIFGTAADGSTLNPTKVNLAGNTNSGKVGSVDLSGIESRDWYLTLAVCTTVTGDTADKTDVLADAVLIGYANIDMLYGKEATFTLTSEGLEKAGNVKISLYSDGWQASDFGDTTTFQNQYTVSVGIYNRTTGEVIKDKSNASTEVDSFTLPDDFDSPAAYGAAGGINVKPGTYLFQVTFTKKSDTSKKFAYHDVLIVIPGKTITETIAVPNIIGKLPVAPTDFKADFKGDDADIYEGYYATHFYWTNPSALNNETGFEIEIAELDDNNTSDIILPTDAATWGTAIAAPSTGNAYKAATSKVYGPGDWFGGEVYFPAESTGSLLATNTDVYFKLKLGKRYLARLRSANDAGSSAWVYVALPAPASSEHTAFHKYTESTQDYQTINLYRITYHLQQGLYYASGKNTANTDITSNNVIVYSSQFKDQLILYSDEWDSSTNTPKTNNPTIVKKGGSIITPTYTAWASWKTGDGKQYQKLTTIHTSGSTTESPDDAKTWYYYGFQNQDLYAIYGSDGGAFEIVDPTDYAIKGTWITIGGTALASDTTTTATVVKGSSTISLKVPSTAGFVYNSVSITVEKGGATTASMSTANVTANTPINLTSSLSSGTYLVTFTAKYGTAINSYQVVLTVTNS